MKHLVTSLFAILTIFSVAACSADAADDDDSSSQESALICREDAKRCPNGTYVTRTGPNCTFPSCPTTVCSKDAKVCPDGTVLGRTGPNCTFPPCPA